MPPGSGLRRSRLYLPFLASFLSFFSFAVSLGLFCFAVRFLFWSLDMDQEYPVIRQAALELGPEELALLADAPDALETHGIAVEGDAALDVIHAEVGDQRRPGATLLGPAPRVTGFCVRTST